MKKIRTFILPFTVLILLIAVFAAGCRKDTAVQTETETESLPGDMAYDSDIPMPKIKYNGLNYSYIDLAPGNTVKVPEGYTDSGTLAFSEGKGSDFPSEDMRVNMEKYAGYSVYSDEDEPDCIYISDGTDVCLFGTWEYKADWIFYDGSLFADDRSYYMYYLEEAVTGDLFNEKEYELPEGSELVGESVLGKGTFPAEDLHTCTDTLAHRNVYYNAVSDCVYIELVMSDTGGGHEQTVYKEFLRTDVKR